MQILINFVIGVISFLIFIALIYLLILIRPRAKKPKNTRLLCEYAHRGLHGDGVPENSLQAFSLACEGGYGIELDVQLSSDGEAMVFHDYSLKRMTSCEKKLCELTLNELKSLTLADTEEKIPTLCEVLTLIDGRVPLLIELKGESTDISLCEAVAKILTHYKGDYCIESFNPMLVRGMKKHLPQVYCGLLYTNVCRDKKKMSPLNIALSAMALNFLAYPDFIAYNKSDRNSIFVWLTTALYRAPRFVWTVKGESERNEAKALGECPIFEKK